MKFSINNLLSKYNLVLIISILFILLVVYIVFNANSYKEHMDNPFLKKMNFNSLLKKSQNNKQEVDRQPTVDRQEVEIIPEIEIPEPDISSIVSANLLIPVCTLFDENNCSKNNYCLWNSDKKMCNKLNVCELLDNNHCNNSINCAWNTTNKKCYNK